MITRHHLALSLICGLILFAGPAGTDPLLLMVILSGIGMGAVLPDLHMKRPSRTRLLTIAWYLVRIGRLLVIPVVCRLLSLVPGTCVQPDDKRLTHSVPGIILYSMVCTVPGFVIALFMPGSPAGPVLLVWSGGVFLGMALHLVQDLCTRKGITPLHPFLPLVLHGTIRPCDLQDDRIYRFHLQHILALGAFQVALITLHITGPAALTCGYLCTALCIVAMVRQSGVQADRDVDRLPVVNGGVDG